MSEFVTGDAVVLGVRPARLPSRALALLIDMAVVWSVYLAVTVGLAFATASLDGAATAAIMVASFLLVLVGVPIAVETLTRGRSLGKLACGLRVVRDDGGPIRFRHALVRGAVGVVEILMTFGVIACIASLVSQRGRRVGDVFAGTLVVRERVSAGRTDAVPAPPPWLAGRFAELDLSRVPDGLWLAVRQYLTRMRQLDPRVGDAMAGRLAADLAGLTGVQVPAGVPAAAYLAAVVHERQVRDTRRAFRASGARSVAGADTGSHAGADTADTGSRAGGAGWQGPSDPFAAPSPVPAAGPGPDLGSGTGPGPGPGPFPGAGPGLGPGLGHERGQEPGVGPERSPAAASPVAPVGEAAGGDRRAAGSTGFAPPA
ncbi:RDD family protein [Streptomyces sp. NPDC091272]|uniref:RDD family protein n=1 Tax=Streptomyces sp. NPDC091272 TaxID=3365981 RepID=UPI0038282986